MLDDMLPMFEPNVGLYAKVVSNYLSVTEYYLNLIAEFFYNLPTQPFVITEIFPNATELNKMFRLFDNSREILDVFVMSSNSMQVRCLRMCLQCIHVIIKRAF